jgi:hypothetical protein
MTGKNKAIIIQNIAMLALTGFVFYVSHSIFSFLLLFLVDDFDKSDKPEETELPK